MAKRKRSVRLKNAHDIRRFLAKKVNEYMRDEVESDEIRDLGYVCKIILDAVKVVEIEQELKDLKQIMKNAGLLERD